MALNNLERYAGGRRPRRAVPHARGAPGRRALLARLGGTSQFLADALRRPPVALAWLLEPRTMRVWFADEFAADLAQSLAALPGREARMNALRRFKYRQLLRIGARDLLGDADLAVTTEELARLADICLGEAWGWRDAERLEGPLGTPVDVSGEPTGLAVIGMGKLGGIELNYSSDIDPMFVYGADGETAGGQEGRLANGEYFARGARDPRDPRVGHRGGPRVPGGPAAAPEGRSGALGALARRLPPYYRGAGRAVGAPGAAQGAGLRGRRARGARFMDVVRGFVYRPGLDPQSCPRRAR